MGNWKRLNILIFTLLSAFVMGFSVQAGAIEEKELEFSLLIFERASRVELASQKLKLQLNGKPASFPVNVGKNLKGAKVTVTGRPVQINSEPGYYWFEITLKDSAGKTVSYGTSTVSGRKFSFGTGFRDPNDSKQEMVLMLDSTGTEMK